MTKNIYNGIIDSLVSMYFKVGDFVVENSDLSSPVKLCPLSLEEIDDSQSDSGNVPNGSILVKKKGYFIMRVNDKHDIYTNVQNLVESSNSAKEKELELSNELMLLYMSNNFVGLKSNSETWFVSDFKDSEFKSMLKNYVPQDRKEKIDKKFKRTDKFKPYW